MLTGEKCFEVNNKQKKPKKYKIDKKDFIPVKKKNPDVPENIAAIVDAMLRINKNKEYQSMSDVKADIDDVLSLHQAPPVLETMDPFEAVEMKGYNTKKPYRLKTFAAALVILGIIAAGIAYADKYHLIQLPEIKYLNANIKKRIPQDILLLDHKDQLKAG